MRLMEVRSDKRLYLILIAVILSSVLSLGLVSFVHADWLSGWDQRIKFTVNGSYVDNDLTNFSLLLYLSNSSGENNEDISLIFDELGSNSLKIAITENDGVSELYAQVEYWDHVNEKAYIWVKGDLSNSSDEDFYLYYDNSHADNTAYIGDDPEDSASNNVWSSDFYGVWLLSEVGDGSADEFKDSSGNSNHGQGGGGDSGKTPTRISGKIGYGQDFDGTDDYINCSDLDRYNNITIIAWVNTSTTDNGNLISKAHYDDSGYSCQITTDGDMSISMGDSGGWESYHNDQINTGNFIHIMYVWDESNDELYLYRNGDLSASFNESDVVPSNNYPLTFGRDSELSWAEYQGTLDSIRILNVHPNHTSYAKALYESERDNFITWNSSPTYANAVPSAESFNVSDLTDGFKIVADGRSYSSDLYLSDSDGYSDLDTGMFAFNDSSGQWYNVTIDLSAPSWTRSTDCPMSVTGQAVSYPNSTYAVIETALELQGEASDTDGVSVYAWVNDTAGASSGWTLLDADAFDIVPSPDDDDGDDDDPPGPPGPDPTPDPSSDICNRSWLQSQDIGVLVRICDSNGLAYESGATKADLVRLILCELCDMCELADCQLSEAERLSLLYDLQAMEWADLIEYGRDLGAGTTKWDSREEAILKIFINGHNCPVPDEFYSDPDVPGDDWDPDDWDGDGEPNDVDPEPLDPFEDSSDSNIPDAIEPYIPGPLKPWIQRWGDEIIIGSSLVIFLLAALSDEEKKKKKKQTVKNDYLGIGQTRADMEDLVKKLKKDVWEED